ncbi:MFS transporter, partial [Klebsiella pneumoniae]|uniref:MFS transporter n=1 Tax=Klebsiella pneumoniae TaxID=573 RepID=UPI0025A08270
VFAGKKSDKIREILISESAWDEMSFLFAPSLSYGLVMIFFLYMYVCFASAVYVPELWPTHLRLRGSGFVNAVGRIVAVFTPYGVAVLLTRSGAITVFMVLGVMLVLCALILFCFGIETRKISLEEISTLA